MQIAINRFVDRLSLPSHANCVLRKCVENKNTKLLEKFNVYRLINKKSIIMMKKLIPCCQMELRFSIKIIIRDMEFI